MSIVFTKRPLNRNNSRRIKSFLSSDFKHRFIIQAFQSSSYSAIADGGFYFENLRITEYRVFHAEPYTFNSGTFALVLSKSQRKQINRTEIRSADLQENRKNLFACRRISAGKRSNVFRAEQRIHGN